MLTINQVARLYEAGVDIVFSRKSHPLGFKGEWTPDLLLAFIYLPAIISFFDGEITTIHELIHAKNDLVYRRNSRNSEREVEREALRTYHKRPEVLQFIGEIYSLNHRISLP